MQRMARQTLTSAFALLVALIILYQLLKLTARYAPGPISAGATMAADWAGFDEDFD